MRRLLPTWSEKQIIFEDYQWSWFSEIVQPHPFGISTQKFRAYSLQISVLFPCFIAIYSHCTLKSLYIFQIIINLYMYVFIHDIYLQDCESQYSLTNYEYYAHKRNDQKNQEAWKNTEGVWELCHRGETTLTYEQVLKIINIGNPEHIYSV